MLLCSSFSIYLVRSNEITRKRYLDQWLGLGLGLDFDFVKEIGLESEHGQWKKWLLPNNKLCLENASSMHIIRDKLPYIIDPDEMSKLWISSFFGEGIQTTCKTDQTYADTIDLGLRYGKTVIITDSEGVDPYLYPIVKGYGYFICKDSHMSVVLGGNRITIEKGFYMLITTRNANACPLPSIKGYVTELNFSMNESGLEKQLLNILLDSKDPELGLLMSHLNKEEEKYRTEMLDLESNLLDQLSTADGDVLQNSSLINTLALTKEKSEEISLSLNERREKSNRLLEYQRTYQSSARFGSKLFSLISNLHVVSSVFRKLDFSSPNFM